ncbi:MAG TPA: HDIG domain-containing protein [Polyangiaceae bacterium]|nr:HDIG domain-containing protein [Polyangiaceae bacterium]
MSISSAQVLRSNPAVEALQWATAVACGEPEVGDARPRRPSEDAWRALSAGDVRRFLDPLLLGRRPDAGLDALLEIGFLDAWLPEISAMVGFGDGEWRHKDVWKHTKQVVWQSVPRLTVRWGALLHDIGKIKTRTIGDDGEVHFFGHSEVGASMFKKRVARRLGFEGELHGRIHFLILHHLRASQYDGSWTDSAVRRFAREMGDGLKDLLDLSRADITTKRPEKRKRGLRQISELSRRVKELAALDARVAPLPKGLGTALSEALGIPPSRRLGELRNELERRCERGELAAQQSVDFYVHWVREHAAELGL